MEMDFTPRPGEAWAANFESVIDKAMQAVNAAQPPRGYLGASRIGDDCLRKLAYEFHHTPRDEGREFSGRTLRIFERGHVGEDMMAARLRLAGFEIVTHKQDGSQIGFGVAWDEARNSFRFAGHIDGVITRAPYDAGVSVACLWENKILGNKGFNDVVSKGVRKSKPLYYAQMQIYMAYLDLTDHPGLFTAENADTGTIYAEKVEFDRAEAQALSDKAARIIATQAPEEMPRIAKDATDYRCKICDFALRCHAPAVGQPAPEAAPGWLTGA